MDNLQRSEFDAFNRVTDFNTKHLTDLNTITEYQAEKAKFNAAVLSIKNAGITQLQKGIDQTISFTAKKLMADTVIKYCLRAGVIARSLQNMQLAGQLQGSASSILRATKTEAIEMATVKRNALNSNLTILTNITAANITDIDNAIAAYNVIKDAPTEVRQTKKSTATDLLPGLYAKANDAVNNMYELVFSYFSVTKPDLVHEMEIAKQVIATGIRTTSITFDCLADEDGSAIHNFTVTDKSNNKTYQSNDEGILNIDHHIAGLFHFTIAAPARINIDFTTAIKKGTNNHFTIRLKK
jgi:hypothetical protein